MKRPRILFVALPDSVHTARWISQLAGLGWDVHLFASSDGVPHPSLRHVTVHSLSIYRTRDMRPSVRVFGLWPWQVGAQVLLRALREFRLGRFLHVMWLACLIRWLKPDIIQTLEIQHAGYLTLAAKPYAGKYFPKWIVTNWGSDLYLFSRLAAHFPRIKAVLAACDYYSCECQRDVQLARQLGFKGIVFPVVPNSGGFDLDRIMHLQQPGSVSSRRVVVVKGYQHWAGRALVALRAIALCSNELADYEIAVYLASSDVKVSAELLAVDTGLCVRTVPPCSHDEMLRLFGSARIYIGLSISDAISTSLLEAMVMGAFPIQSHTACADEWVVDGETGMLVPPEDPEIVAAALRRALADDALVDHAAIRNGCLARERLAVQVIQPQVVDMYRNLLTSVASR